MSNIFDFLINRPMGWILNQLSNLVGGNFALAVFLFTLLINILLIPLSIKTQKSSAKQAMLGPKLELLKQKYGNDRVKYNEEMQKLYAQEGVSLSGGCLPLFIRLPIMMGIYYAVNNPLSNLINLSAEVVARAKELCTELIGKAARELDVVYRAGDLIDQVPELKEIERINFNFFGINLTQTPEFSLNIFGEFQLIWLIPLLSFTTAMLTSLVTMSIQKKNNPGAPSLKGMMFTMPIISLVIAFSVPGALGFYWACSNLIAGTIQVIMQYFYSANKIIAVTQAQSIIKRYETEQMKIKRVQEYK